MLLFPKNINNNFPNEDMEVFEHDNEIDGPSYVVENIPGERDFDLNKELLNKSKNLLFKTNQFIELHKFNLSKLLFPGLFNCFIR